MFHCIILSALGQKQTPSFRMGFCFCAEAQGRETNSDFTGKNRMKSGKSAGGTFDS
jgi:hypothetical protein